MNRIRLNSLDEHSLTHSSDTPSKYARYMLELGRNYTHAPYLGLSPESTDALRSAQQELKETFPNAKLIDQLHVTVLYCQPQYLFTALSKIRGIDPSQADPTYEATFYSDVLGAIEATTMFEPLLDDMPVESLSVFDEKRGTVALQLADSAISGYWRQQTRKLMHRNLSEFHGLSSDEETQLIQDPKLTWLFQDSIPHVSLLHGATSTEGSLPPVTLPKSISFNEICAAVPEDLRTGMMTMFDMGE